MTRVARKLRRGQTDAESLLWSKLRAGQLGGAKFRRQFPLAPYAVDFCCEAARLIVEVDGGQHAESRGEDEARTESFARGYRVIRVWNSDVLGNVDGVLEEILRCMASPSP
ncbi:MAG: endonuclease domain-containing protein [Gemmatimonadetes bacterium]|nr:endonuclease domain-containing protein [Gemmatimonadota bacterium]